MYQENNIWTGCVRIWIMIYILLYIVKICNLNWRAKSRSAPKNDLGQPSKHSSQYQRFCCFMYAKILLLYKLTHVSCIICHYIHICYPIIKQGLLICRWVTHWFQLCTLKVSLLAYMKRFYWKKNPRVLECWYFRCGFGSLFCMRLFHFF